MVVFTSICKKFLTTFSVEALEKVSTLASFSAVEVLMQCHLQFIQSFAPNLPHFGTIRAPLSLCRSSLYTYWGRFLCTFSYKPTFRRVGNLMNRSKSSSKTVLNNG